MPAKSKAAAVVVVAALLGGCAQAPPSSYPRPSCCSVDDWIAAMRPEIERQERRNSYAPQAPVVVVPQIAPVREAPPEPKRLQPEKPVNAETGNKEGAIAAASPPPPQSPAPVAKTPADTACVGWWRICKFL